MTEASASVCLILATALVLDRQQSIQIVKLFELHLLCNKFKMIFIIEEIQLKLQAV